MVEGKTRLDQFKRFWTFTLKFRNTETRRTSNLNINLFKYWLMQPNWGLRPSQMMVWHRPCWFCVTSVIILRPAVCLLCSFYFESSSSSSCWNEKIYIFFSSDGDTNGTKDKGLKAKSCPEPEPALEAEPGPGGSVRLPVRFWPGRPGVLASPLARVLATCGQ